MTCAACGTRISNSSRKCPNCGRTAKAARSGAPADATSSGLEPSSAQVPGRRQGLRDPKSPGKAKPRSAAKPKAASPSAAARPEPATPPPTTPSPDDSLSDSLVEEEMLSIPGFSEIRRWIHDCPDRLEEGLSIYTDSSADPVGVDFSTDVGVVDLLARDDAGGLVLVLVPAPASQGDVVEGKDLVAEALERVGWVRKHVAEPAQEVRAIVLLDQIPEDISYAAAAVASTLAFKTYRMEVSFSDVEV